MIHLLQIKSIHVRRQFLPASSHTGNFCCRFSVFLMILTHLLGPKRKTSDKLQNFASGIESHGDARQPMAIKYFLDCHIICVV